MNLSEVLVDNDNKRIDSEYFRKQFISFFKDVPNLKPLGYFVKEGYRVVYENTKTVDPEEAIKNNYPYFLQATDLDTPFIRKDNLFFVDNEQWERYPKGRIKAGEILIEVKGKIDKVAIVPDDFPKKTLVTGSLFKLTVNEKISKHVLLAYLISKYGTAFKDRFKTNLLISYVSKPDLYRIPIPSFSDDIQIKIDELFQEIFKSKKESKKLYSQAEKLLLNEIGLNNFEPSKEAVNVKTFSESFGVSGRLDSEFFQKKYESIESKIKGSEAGFSYINSEFKHIAQKSKKQLAGYNYIEIGDINVSDGSFSYSYIETSELPANAKTIVRTGDILISNVRPNRGAVCIIDHHIENCIVSGAFTVLREKENSVFSVEVLKVLLRTSYYRDLLLKFNVGTSYPVIKDKDVLKLPIPKIDREIQLKITENIQKAQNYKKQSEQLLEIAKRSVEIAIEKDESAAMKYINEQTATL